jgi:hypothetical protein
VPRGGIAHEATLVLQNNREGTMSRGNVVVSSAIVVFGATVLSGSSVAQQPQTLKQQIQGAWNLVSCEAKAPFCVNPSGSVSLNGNGRYTIVLAAKGRPKVTNTNPGRANVTPEDYKSIAQGVVANFGTWSVNEADKTLSLHIEGALFPNAEGTEGKSTIASVTSDEMKISGGPLVNATWRRFK